MKFVIIGGVASGMSAAARARRLSEDAEIIVLEAGPYVSFANCALPYYLGKEITDHSVLLLHTPESLAKRSNLDVRVNSKVTAINRQAQQVTVAGPEGEYQLDYDYLLLSPGTVPFIPPIPGADHPSVTGLRTVPELDALMESCEEIETQAKQAGRKPHATVMGGGFIGLEAMEGFHNRGWEVALVEAAPQVMAPLDEELVSLIHKEIRDNGVDLHLNTPASAIRDGVETYRAQVELGDSGTLNTDVVVMSVGVRPRTELAQAAELELGEAGGIRADANQFTNDPRVLAAGDATEVTFADGHEGLVLLAGPANRQGRRAADVVLGEGAGVKPTPVQPVLGTAIVRVFSLAAATTGATRRQLRQAGTQFITVRLSPPSHASYYPGHRPVNLMVFFGMDGRLLGAQAVGADGADKRIDVLATAIRGGMTCDDLGELELCYSPPYGSAKDPVNNAGFIAQNVLSGICPQTEPDELAAAVAEGVILDVRNSGEADRAHIPGSIFVPLPQLRERIEEVRQAAGDKTVHVLCASGHRSYLATRICRQAGIEAKNISGGTTVVRRTNPELFVSA